MHPHIEEANTWAQFQVCETLDRVYKMKKLIWVNMSNIVNSKLTIVMKLR